MSNSCIPTRHGSRTQQSPTGNAHTTGAGVVSIRFRRSSGWMVCAPCVSVVMLCELYASFLVQGIINRKGDRGHSGFDVRHNLSPGFCSNDSYRPNSIGIVTTRLLVKLEAQDERTTKEGAASWSARSRDPCGTGCALGGVRCQRF